MVDNPHLDDPSLRDLPGLGQRNRASRAPDRDFELGVLRLLETHGEAEGALLDAYSKVAERSSGKGATEFLVQLILDDEYRHHQMFAEMANALRSYLWEVPVRPSLPSMPVHSDPDLLAETKRLLAFEKHDAKELRKLRKTLKHGPSSSLDPLMVELMLHDTAKHIAILEFIEAHLTN